MRHKELMEWAADRLDVFDSPKRIAQQIGVKPGCLYRLLNERGKSNPFWPNFAKVGDFFGARIMIRDEEVRLVDWDRICNGIWEHSANRTWSGFCALRWKCVRMKSGVVSSDWQQVRFRTCTMVGCIARTRGIMAFKIERDKQ